MRCQSPTEVEEAFGPLGFSVDLERQWYRSALVLDAAQAADQIRLAAAQPSDIARLDYFRRLADIARQLRPHRILGRECIFPFESAQPVEASKQDFGGIWLHTLEGLTVGVGAQIDLSAAP